MTGINETRYSFLVEWYDDLASITRKFCLRYFISNNTVELVELKNGKTFLKRIKCDGVTLKSIYLGSTLNIFSRQMKITDYGDDFTRESFSQVTQRTYGMLKPESVPHLGKILDEIYARGFKVTNAKMCQMSEDNAKEFYKEHEERTFFPTLVRHMSSAPVVALELMGKDAIKSWRREIGPTDVEQAKDEAPNSLRALYGLNKTQNGFHGSDSPESAERELEIFFPSKVPSRRSIPRSTATFENSTCCVILPHVVEEGHLGRIISEFQNSSFEISAMRMFYLNKTDVQEFYEVYEGVIPEHNGMVGQLMSGPSVALEIKHPSCKSQEEIVSKFRLLVGPSDPEIARELRPQSIRAKYGATKVKNAVHCTDLPEDGSLEVEYFFKILE
ncbi:nucleoside diphosphate kinase 7 isoform X2 [Ischnura elegans]|uniref:nucleoside diphosphate kinase 7 isoform X2 n=1 Tax=Ischnura elegans TaxID=197161 RepID=UPI001ED8674E|nr:nucleoside diphosphate kinase 7 isoform X2 [Ischnura elegans]